MLNYLLFLKQSRETKMLIEVHLKDLNVFEKVLSPSCLEGQPINRSVNVIIINCKESFFVHCVTGSTLVIRH